MNGLKNILKKKRGVLLASTLALILFVFLPSFAHAEWAENIAISAGMKLVNTLLYSVMAILGILLSGVGQMANGLLQPSPLTTAPIVIQGWTLTRDFANMFFILILLGISLDFILFNSFGVKQALPRLLGVALLINFSLPIAGILIDFANIFSNFFISQISGGAGITEVMAQSMNLASLYASSGGSPANAAAAREGLFFDLVFGIGLMVGTIFIFFALSIMFLIRQAYLFLLLIILPLVLVLSAFPPTKNHFSKWTSKFVQWTMFAPIALFFLYLSLTFFSTITTTDAYNAIQGGEQKTILQQIYTYITIWVFMLGSLFAGQAMGIKASGTALAIWSKGTKWARGKALRTGGKAGAWATRKTGMDEKVGKAAEWASKIGAFNALGVTRGATAIAEKTKEFAKGKVPQKELDAYKGYSDENLRNVYKSSSGSRKATVGSMLAQRGKLQVRDATGGIDKDATEALVREAYALNKTHGNKADLTNIRRASPGTFIKIKQEEWEKAKREGGRVAKSTVKKNADGSFADVDVRSGLTLEETIAEAYDIRTNDLENMRGLWTNDLMKGFILSGELTGGFIKAAYNNNDSEFLRTLNATLQEEAGAMIDNDSGLKKKNEPLYNSLRSGKLDEFIDTPNYLREKEIKEESPKKRDIGKEIDEKRKQFDG